MAKFSVRSDLSSRDRSLVGLLVLHTVRPLLDRGIKLDIDSIDIRVTIDGHEVDAAGFFSDLDGRLTSLIDDRAAELSEERIGHILSGLEEDVSRVRDGARDLLRKHFPDRLDED